MLLKIEKLRICFETKNPASTFVEDVNLNLNEKEIAVIVGRSGSGKSLTAQAILGLVKGYPGVTGGEIQYNDNDFYFSVKGGNAFARINGKKKLYEDAYKEIRGRKISMVFQEHKSALNPLFTVGEHLSDTLITHKKCDKKEAKKESIEWLKKVYLGKDNDERNKIIDMYPCHLSGGIAQRLMIALALCTNPKLLIADEPTTNLDASIQNSIIDLIFDFLDDEKNSLCSLLFITHDIRIIERILCSSKKLLSVAFFDKGRSVEKILAISVDELYNKWQEASAKEFFESIKKKHLF